MNTIKIGKYIKSRRVEQHLTQKELAKKLDISFQAVSKWETGVTLPDTMILLKLSNILEVSTDKILSAGEINIKTRKQINVPEIKEGIDGLLKLRETLGVNNFIIKAIYDALDKILETSFELIQTNPRKKEIIVAKMVISMVMDGDYILPKDIHSHFTNPSLISKLEAYCKKYAHN